MAKQKHRYFGKHGVRKKCLKLLVPVWKYRKYKY